jgi:peptide/nickel transport system substrate-binding protein
MMELPPSDVWQWDTLADYEQDTGNQITQFSESPMLAARVRAGELPPVEERLPEEPLVLNVLEELGAVAFAHGGG